jgi:hypothetical protein
MVEEGGGGEHGVGAGSVIRQHVIRRRRRWRIELEESSLSGRNISDCIGGLFTISSQFFIKIRNIIISK